MSWGSSTAEVGGDKKRRSASGDAAALQELPVQLARLGYHEYYASFNPLAPRLPEWEKRYCDVPDRLRPVIGLFLLGIPVPRTSLNAELIELLEPLCRLGLLKSNTDDEVYTPGLVLLPILGLWLFCHKPQINPTLYFGDDSMALITRVRPRPGKTCLDLCTGPGIQALHCSNFAHSVDAVDINPLATALAQINVIMNEREDIVRVHRGNLYEPVRGHAFDTVIANPPLLPTPDHIKYPFVGRGGPDGMSITWRILQGLPTFLRSEGIAQLIGSCLSDGILPLCKDELESWSVNEHMNILMTITAHHLLQVGSPYFEGLVQTATTATGLSESTVSSAYEQMLSHHTASHLCAYYLHVTHGTGELCIQDLSPELPRGFWYV